MCFRYYNCVISLPMLLQRICKTFCGRLVRLFLSISSHCNTALHNKVGHATVVTKHLAKLALWFSEIPLLSKDCQIPARRSRSEVWGDADLPEGSLAGPLIGEEGKDCWRWCGGVMGTSLEGSLLLLSRPSLPWSSVDISLPLEGWEGIWNQIRPVLSKFIYCHCSWVRLETEILR